MTPVKNLSNSEKKLLADTRKAILEYVDTLEPLNDKTRKDYIKEINK